MRSRSSLVIALIVAMIILTYPVLVASCDWDKSSLSAEGVCAAGGSLRVTVTNTGSSMVQTVDWRFKVGGIITSSGTLQLAAGESTTLQSLPAPNQKIIFTVDQAPGHPGIGVVKVEKSCSPTSVKLQTFGASWTLIDWVKGLFR